MVYLIPFLALAAGALVGAVPAWFGRWGTVAAVIAAAVAVAAWWVVGAAEDMGNMGARGVWAPVLMFLAPVALGACLGASAVWLVKWRGRAE